MINLEKEIREQPAVLAGVTAANLATVHKIVEDIRAAGVTNVQFAARGTSDHAAIYAQYLIHTLVGIPCGLTTPSVVSKYNGKLAFEKLTRGENPIAKEQPSKPSATTNETIQGSQEVSVFNIKTNQDLDVVVDYINRGEPVIANLGKVTKKEQQRTQDFLSGVVFALNANISLLVQDMYLITPEGIVIDKK